MESLDKVVLVIEEEIAVVKKKMRKLRDKKQYSADEFFDLKEELRILEAAWDMLS